MNRKNKQFLALLLVAIMLIGTGVPVFAADSQTSYSVQVNKPEPKTVASEAQSKSVSTFAEFKSAVEAGTPVKLTADITATSNIGTSSKCIDKDIVIYGNGKKLNMGAYQFLLSGSHTLSISDLTLDTATTNSTHRYGVFCIRAGSATSSKYVWDSQFHNFTFMGSALIGVYNTDDYAATTRMFNSAIFTGKTNISITNGYRAYNGVVHARNIGISGTFVMKDDIKTTNTGASNSTYQHYFKSPGTGGVDSEPENSVAYGVFYVDDNADVTITRSPGRGSDGVESAYYRSLIYGYADHNFGENAKFTAKAGTNLTATSLLYRSAVIRSNNAGSFVVRKNADVKLETDLYNNTSSASKNGSYGFTALSLKKSNALTILVEQGATLDILADGRNTTPSYGTRSQAPVVIRGSGSSSTIIQGNLKVYSENSNGWYYKYETSRVGKAEFIVEGTGNAKIQANNLGVKAASEYAAFEAYGVYDVDIIVRGGGKMSVISNGYRGMSLAGAGGYTNKNILVTGAGSELAISGVHWAIAAETQPVLSIAAENGGKIDLRTTGDVGDGYSSAGSAPSTIYSVGPTTYKVDGAGSEMKIHHSGGTYSAIFHDGYGPLKIYVTNGGVMDVENKNSGTDTSARRAAITAQSTGSGSKGSYDNEILVSGEGSYLSVSNNNPVTHGNGGDTGLYPSGAVSFNSSAKGNIKIADGGSFKAVSSSLAPTVHLYQGKITFDSPGEFEIRNNATSSSSGNNNTYATFGQAVYNERYRNSGSFPTAIEFKNVSVSVWGLLKNGVDFSETSMDNHWDDVSFTAKNGTITTVSKNGTGGTTTLQANQFDLSAYGKIGGIGSPGEPSAPPTIDNVYEEDTEVTGTGIAGSTITVTFPDESTENVTVDSNNKWKATSKKSFVKGEVIKAYQTEVDKSPSEEVEKTVLPKPSGLLDPVPAKVNPIYVFWYDTITGYGEPGAMITVTICDEHGEPLEGVRIDPVTVKDDGTWEVKNPKRLELNNQVKVKQEVEGHDPWEDLVPVWDE